MNPSSRHKIFVSGPAGRIEVTVDEPRAPPRGVALIAHPHPLFGGTADNKVVYALAKAFSALGHVALRPSFRGVGQSAGAHDNGVGETEDLLALAGFARAEFGDLPLALAGFSFGAAVQTRVAQRLPCEHLVLVAPAVGRFAAAEVPPETLVIHGEQDDVVPLPEVLEWARPQHLPVVVFPGAGHFFHGRLHRLQHIVTRYCR